MPTNQPLTPGTRPLHWHELLDFERDLIGRLAHRLDQRLSARRSPPEPPPRRAPPLWPPPAEDRQPGIFTFDGARGTGKTTLLITFVEYLREARSPQRRLTVDCPQEVYAVLQRLAPEVAVLDTIPFSRLPDHIPVLSRFFYALVAAARKFPHQDALQEEAVEALATATIGWSKRLPERESAEFVDLSMDVEQRISSLAAVQDKWRTVVSKLMHAADLAEGLLIVPVDDVDLQDRLVPHILHALHLLDCPGTAFLVTGDRRHAITQVARAQRGPQRMEVAVSIVDKALPMSDCFPVRGFTRAEALAWNGGSLHGALAREQLAVPAWIPAPPSGPAQPGPRPSGTTRKKSSGRATTAARPSAPHEHVTSLVDLLLEVEWDDGHQIPIRKLATWDAMHPHARGTAGMELLQLRPLDDGARVTVSHTGASTDDRVLPVIHRGTNKLAYRVERTDGTAGTASPADLLAAVVSRHVHGKDRSFAAAPLLVWADGWPQAPGVAMSWPLAPAPTSPAEAQALVDRWDRLEGLRDDLSRSGIAWRWIQLHLGLEQPPAAEPGNREWGEMLASLEPRHAAFMALLSAPEYGLPPELRRLVMQALRGTGAFRLLGTTIVSERQARLLACVKRTISAAEVDYTLRELLEYFDTHDVVSWRQLLLGERVFRHAEPWDNLFFQRLPMRDPWRATMYFADPRSFAMSALDTLVASRPRDLVARHLAAPARLSRASTGAWATAMWDAWVDIAAPRPGHRGGLPTLSNDGTGGTSQLKLSDPPRVARPEVDSSAFDTGDLGSVQPVVRWSVEPALTDDAPTGSGLLGILLVLQSAVVHNGGQLTGLVVERPGTIELAGLTLPFPPLSAAHDIEALLREAAEIRWVAEGLPAAVGRSERDGWQLAAAFRAAVEIVTGTPSRFFQSPDEPPPALEFVDVVHDPSAFVFPARDVGTQHPRWQELRDWSAGIRQQLSNLIGVDTTDRLWPSGLKQ